MYPGTASSNKQIPKKSIPVHFKADAGNGPAVLAPAVNISETAAEYVMIIAAPGLQQQDFTVTIEHPVISISAQKEEAALSPINDRVEFDFHDWSRAFILPEDADALLAQAMYRNGELVIRIPKGKNDKNITKTTVYVY